MAKIEHEILYQQMLPGVTLRIPRNRRILEMRMDGQHNLMIHMIRKRYGKRKKK